MRVARTLALLPLLAACHGLGRGGGHAVSSERSDYAPVVRLDVVTRVVGDSVRVDVRRGTVLSPAVEGAVVRGANLRVLSIAALLVAAPRDAGDSLGTAREHPWSALAEGTAQPLADSLVPGVAQPVAPRRWVLPRAAGLDAGRTWIVFRITGDAATSAVRLADGGEIPAGVRAGAVRVYACAERSVTGRRDRARARRMRESYTAGC